MTTDDYGDAPKARTPEEIRGDFLDTCRGLADYWASAYLRACSTSLLTNLPPERKRP